MFIKYSEVKQFKGVGKAGVRCHLALKPIKKNYKRWWDQIDPLSRNAF